MKYSGIGGQAVIEGVMMRNKNKYAIAVRKPDGEIEVKTDECGGIAAKNAFFRLPFIRGMVNFIDSLVLGMSTLTYSTSFMEEDEDAPKKTEEEKKKSDAVFNVITILISVVLAVGVFMVGPYYLSLLIGRYIKSESLVILIEGLIRVGIFVGYVSLISLMKDIKRVYMYHGAEHKTIFCYESDEELTVENVKKQSRFHPRCGTSFMVLMLIVGIVIGLFIPVAPFGIGFLRPVIKILLLPLTCGIGYELIKICGKHDNALTRIIAAPGLWAQRITTKEPDDKMIEVAIEAIKAVIPEDGSDIVSK